MPVSRYSVVSQYFSVNCRSVTVIIICKLLVETRNFLAAVFIQLTMIAHHFLVVYVVCEMATP